MERMLRRKRAAGEEQPEPAHKRFKESNENPIKMKIFHDPIHGQIELHPLLVKFIDTPEFQRLRHIKQLGIKYLIYPGATHTRFEHSIGVAYLAECMVKILREKQPDLEITDEDLLCVQIAALCHDLGHGPFSHLFDGMFIPEVQEKSVFPTEEKWEHERASVEMFHFMLKKNPLMREMKEYGLDDRDVTFISEIIKGVKISGDQWTARGRSEQKSFLYEIVANKRNGIDVDKWDYLTRDCHYLGIPTAFDLQRLLRSVRVCKVEINTKMMNSICYRDKVADNIYDMFLTRYTLHRQALQHKIGYIIDVMIKDALLLANGQLKPGSNISDAIKNMKDYIKLTDRIFDEILHSDPQHPDLKKAKAILEDIVNRRLPKFVGEARLKEEELEKTLKLEQPELMLDKDIKRKEYQRILKEHCDEMVRRNNLSKDEYVIYVVDLGFGTEKTPIDDVYFYNKSDADMTFSMEQCQVSNLRPKKFHEWIVRVYYKNTKQDYQCVQIRAVNCFHKWCQKNKYVVNDRSHYDNQEISIGETSPVKIFNDSVHGHIELNPVLVKIIDTPQFQRLRNIKQLGANSYVFPGATHTRFEHSIGMAFLAGRLAKVLQEKLKDIDKDMISDEDILCVQIAALCYNLGHGPFSHMFNKRFMPRVIPEDKEWKFEVASVWIFLDIVEKETGTEVFNLSKDNLEFISELIQGRKEKSSRKDKPFLYEIVNNTWNGIDVRRWDYFLRDCHHLGLSNGFDYKRLLKSARVCEKHICYRDTVADNVYDMFHTRYNLYRQSYQHKIGNIIEDKITDAMVGKVNIEFAKITASNLKTDIERKITRITEGSEEQDTNVDETMKEFIKLTDHIFDDILYSTDSNLNNARKEIEDIVNRRLPKFVGEARLPLNTRSKDMEELKNTLKENWERAVNKWTQQNKTVSLDATDFKVDVVKIDHGLKCKSPFDKVHFYSKRNVEKSFKMKKYQVSSLLPEEFEERCVRVYYNKKTDEKEKDAVKCFKKFLTEINSILPDKFFEVHVRGSEEVFEKAQECFRKWCADNFGHPEPKYSNAVEMYITEVAHVTNKQGLQGILSSDGFKGLDKNSCSWWSLYITEDDITEAQKRIPQFFQPNLREEERTAQHPFVRNLTRFPLFQRTSRYGNFRFTFSVTDLMDAYKWQICDGQEPILRFLVFKDDNQDIECVIVVHSPQCNTKFEQLPELASNILVACDGKQIILKLQQFLCVQAICEALKFQLPKHTETGREPKDSHEFYAWDQVSIAFYLKDSETLAFPKRSLKNSITCCEINPAVDLSNGESFPSLYEAEEFLTECLQPYRY